VVFGFLIDLAMEISLDGMVGLENLELDPSVFGIKRERTPNGSEIYVMESENDDSGEFVPRKRPAWMTRLNDAAPIMRVFPMHVLEMVDDLLNLRQDLYGKERGGYLQDFLEDDVAFLVEVLEIPFYTDEDEVGVYAQLRMRAVGVEQAIHDLMKGEGKYKGAAAMPKWRWLRYEAILDNVQNISVLRASTESDEDEFEEEPAEDVVDAPVVAMGPLTRALHFGDTCDVEPIGVGSDSDAGEPMALTDDED
jgi:hypothetical protein